MLQFSKGSEQSILLAFLCSLQAADSAKEEASEEAEVEVPDDLTDPLLEAEVAEEAPCVLKLPAGVVRHRRVVSMCVVLFQSEVASNKSCFGRPLL